MKKILSQTSWLVIAQVLTRIIGFFYTIFLANTLGVSDFGLFTVALAYFSIVSSISDLGFNRYLIREVAKDHLKAPELLCNIVMLRLSLTSVVFALFSLGLYLFDPDKIRTSLILLSVLAILPQSAALTFDGIFIAIQKLEFSATSLFISSIATGLLGYYLVSLGYGPLGAINALILGQLVLCLSLLFFLYRNKILPLSSIKWPILKSALVGSLPFGLLGILGLLYFRIDTIMLSYLKGSYETGLYGVAYRFLEAIIFIPSAFAAAIFPDMAKLHDTDLHGMKKLYMKSLKFMGILGFTIMFGYLIILPLTIKLFLPHYLNSVSTVKILALSIPFIFLSTPGVQVMLSTSKFLKEVIIFSVLTVTLNIILNLIFIPLYGLLGAAWITVLSDVLSFLIFFFFTKYKILIKVR